jgi:hypothetical protein
MGFGPGTLHHKNSQSNVKARHTNLSTLLSWTKHLCMKHVLFLVDEICSECADSLAGSGIDEKV